MNKKLNMVVNIIENLNDRIIDDISANIKDEDSKKALVAAQKKMVTKLPMHKILYYTYGQYYAQTGKELFSADFEA